MIHVCCYISLSPERHSYAVQWYTRRYLRRESFISKIFRTNNAQAPSLFYNVASRRTKSMAYDGIMCLLVTFEKREGTCALLFVRKILDIFTNLPSARKTLLEKILENKK